MRIRSDETISRKGFTLIELLIVVAIIAILAAIAVPNFLEAQVRSKVSRTYADMRSMRTAFEAYYVDNNSYPETDRDQNNLVTNRVMSFYRITTPIAYMTSIPQSPWTENYGSGANPKIAEAINSYLYVRKAFDPYGPAGPGQFSIYNLDYMNDRDAYVISGLLVPQAERGKGEWLLKSAGPDGIDDRQAPGSEPGVVTFGQNARVYDSTNGTVSRGDIAVFSDGAGSLK